MSNGTHGPWVIGELDQHLGYDCMTAGIRIGPVVLDGAQYGQKTCSPLSEAALEQMMADARLIAAAPDMEDALKAILRRLGDIEVLGEWSALEVNPKRSKEFRAAVDADIAKARAALAKATG